MVLYDSETKKSNPIAFSYNKTAQAAYRYLAYRDIPWLISKYCTGDETVDYGAGTGISTEFLINLQLNVVGLDVSKEMLDQAQRRLPKANFNVIENDVIPIPSNSVDLVFSGFVLFELNSKEKLINYLKEGARVLKNTGVFIAVTGNEELYVKNWHGFSVNHKENKHLKSGGRAKITLREENIDFFDFFWTLEDYEDVFRKANLTILTTHFPLGQPNEGYDWKDEKTHAPFVIFVAKKS